MGASKDHSRRHRSFSHISTAFGWFGCFEGLGAFRLMSFPASFLYSRFFMFLGINGHRKRRVSFFFPQILSKPLLALPVGGQKGMSVDAIADVWSVEAVDIVKTLERKAICWKGHQLSPGRSPHALDRSPQYSPEVCMNVSGQAFCLSVVMEPQLKCHKSDEDLRPCPALPFMHFTMTFTSRLSFASFERLSSRIAVSFPCLQTGQPKQHSGWRA